MSWYTLASIVEDQGGLTARFLPDTFNPDSERPVLVVTVLGPVDRPAAITTLGKFRDSFIADYSATPTSFTALSELDWEEWSVHGSSVEVSQRPYVLEELLGIAKGFESLLQAETSRSHAKGRKIGDIEHFVRDLIARAEAKKSLSSRSALALESQIDVLTRVLNRITAS